MQTGIGQILFVAPLYSFTSVKEPKPPFLFDGASVVIFETHEFLPSAGFIQLLLMPNKNDFNAKTGGEVGSQYFNQDIKCLIPGSYAEAHELLKNLINIPLIALVKDVDCHAGFMYQIGSACEPAYLSTDFATGTTRDGIKGYTATVSARKSFVQLYEGQIHLINGNTILNTEGGVVIITEDGQEIITES